ncbi:MAG: N-acetyltransferase [Candidatus Heimdallarchaeota archaeon]|nr:N-acetyltransferase [Candidatus Heimdallarchaeota archaeon]
MNTKDGYSSKRAEIDSKLISPNSCIYGEAKVGYNAIIDPFVIIGYPIRAKIKEILQNESKELDLHDYYDQKSSGAIIGKHNHIRSFTTIYEMSTLEDEVETGNNVLIREKCHIGAGSIIGSGSILDSGVIIGKKARIQSNNFIPPKISIGDDVFLGPNVVFANDRYPVSTKLIETKVENNVRIGIGSILLPGITIKQGAVIAAGSLVTKDVQEFSVVKGSPATVIMTREEYDEKKKSYEDSEY